MNAVIPPQIPPQIPLQIPGQIPGHVPVATMVRDGLVEGVHHGSMAVVGPGGDLLHAVGDVHAPVYPRSALKPLQAITMLRLGLDLPGDLLALATASHSGGEEHLSRVRRILEIAGCTVADLANTPDLPFGLAERAAWIAGGRGPDRLAQNCSGKHAAMLATCRVQGWDTASYLDPTHPLQHAIATTIAQFCDEPVAHRSTDGCGAPLFAVSLLGLARAGARIAGASPDTPEGAVAHALRTWPELVAGEGRDNAALVRAVPGLIAKDGYEAVQLAGTAAGALAVKIADGGDRARLPVATVGLQALGVEPAALQAFETAPVMGGSHLVGELRGLPLP
ncbi:MAG: asparaginase [Janthinobacterium lividum]